MADGNRGEGLRLREQAQRALEFLGGLFRHRSEPAGAPQPMPPRAGAPAAPGAGGVLNEGRGVIYAWVGSPLSPTAVWADVSLALSPALWDPRRTAADIMKHTGQQGSASSYRTVKLGVGPDNLAYCKPREYPNAGFVMFGVIIESHAVDPAEAVTYLSRVERRFASTYWAVTVDSVLRGGQVAEDFSKFRDVLEEEAGAIRGRGADARVAEVKDEIERTKRVMAMNIDSVIRRGENLEQIQDRAEEMQVQASSFQKYSRRVRRGLWTQNLKVKLFVVLLIILVFIVLFFSICGGLGCFH